MARRVFAATVALYAVVVAAGATTLPERVPVHFGLDNRADRYGSRTELVVAFAVGGAALALLFVGLGVLVRKLPLELINVPHADHWKTPEHEPELRRRVHADMLNFGTATVLLLAVIAGLSMHAARSDGQLSGWAYAALTGYLVFVAGACRWLAVTRYRPPVAG